MKVNWEEIVNYALGLATEPEAIRIESDPVALEQAMMLRRVRDAKPTAVPEEMLNRAKALQPSLPPKKIWKGILTFSSSGLGMRSAASTARDLRFEFGTAQVELRLEPIPKSNSVALVGLFQTIEASNVRVSATRSGPVWCDEGGQFELTIESEVKKLTFEDVQTGDIYEVEL